MTTPLPIQPRPPIRGGLESVVTPLPLDESKWRIGVAPTLEDDAGIGLWDANGCEDFGIDVDSGDEVNEKPETSPAGSSAFAPAILTKLVSCNVGGSQSAVGNLILDSARYSFDRMQYRTLAKILQGSLPVFNADGDANPNLSGDFGADGPTYPDGFDASQPGDIKGTLQGLLDLVCSCSHSDPVFHIPRSFMPQFLGTTLVHWDDANGVFRFGPHLVSFDCYTNLGSDELEQATPTAIDGTEVWIWTSSQPMVAFGAQDNLTGLERRQNEYTALVERPAIITFDTQCFGAAKAVIG